MSTIDPPHEPIEDLRAKATVLALHQNRATKLAAIKILHEIVDRVPNAFADRDMLMRLYDELGNWSEARKQMQALVTTEGTRPAHLAHAIISLLEHGAADEAESLLVRLEKIEPQSDRTVEIKARLLKAKGNPREAVALLSNLVKQTPAKAATAALLLEQMGELVAAEDAYRTCAAQSRLSEPYLPLASFLARQNRISESIDLCERAWPTSSRPQAVSAAMVTMLYSSSIDTAQCRRAAELVKRALDKIPNDAALLFHLGNIRSLQGDYQEAERLYNRSIEAEETNSGPLANLAWLLARRDAQGGKALELVARAVKLDGLVPDLLDVQALAYLASGQSDHAIKDLQDAVALSPTALKYLHLAQAYLMADRRDEAAAAFRKRAPPVSTKQSSTCSRWRAASLFEPASHRNDQTHRPRPRSHQPERPASARDCVARRKSAALRLTSIIAPRSNPVSPHSDSRSQAPSR